MISIRQLNDVLSSRNIECTSDNFLKIHRYLEGYIKRVLLIGLRLKGAQYKDSVKIVESTYIHTSALIEKSLFLLNQSGRQQQQVISTLKKNHIDFFLLKEMFSKFTSPYRNQLSHGTVDTLKDQELVDYLFHVDQSFFAAFEKLLLTEFGHSAFDKPGAWGAKQGNTEEMSDTVKRLNLGKIVPLPMQLSSIRKALSETSYTKP